MDNLELYAKVEPLLGIDEATQELHSYYLSFLDDIQPKTLLDIGCGDGSFLLTCKSKGVQAAGIDLSTTQVAKAKAKGLSVGCQTIENTAGSYEMITTIFDVVNFIPPKELKQFFSHIERLLAPKGHFVFDINTLYGFEEVAQGVMVENRVDQTLIVDATYEREQLFSEFTLFSQVNDCYLKEEQSITQYFHSIEALIDATDLTLSIEMPITLYGDEADKAILLFIKD